MGTSTKSRSCIRRCGTFFGTFSEEKIGDFQGDFSMGTGMEIHGIDGSILHLPWENSNGDMKNGLPWPI